MLELLKDQLTLMLIILENFQNILNKLKKDKPVAMFCTGGIRCEKTSVFSRKKRI